MINDQAARLRDISRLKNRADGATTLSPVRRIAITSGKGGVGKSNFSLNLGICFQKLGKRALLIDADTNLANIDILLGISPKFTLADAVLGDRFITEVLFDGPEGLKILPGGSGIIELVGLEQVMQDRLENSMYELEKGQDIVLLDTGAGISEGVVEFASAADEVIVITTPEPTAITDAYAAIKVISARNQAVKFYILVNFARSEDEAREVARNIKLVVENYLAIDIEILGYLPLDTHVQHAVAQQKPFLLAHPRCPASLNLNMIARRLLRLNQPHRPRGSLFRHLFAH
ncbi:MAG: MinD/ParA family protein [bacterium]|nr:MinD/ParA family protein [bacterium]